MMYAAGGVVEVTILAAGGESGGVVPRLVAVADPHGSRHFAEGARELVAMEDDGRGLASGADLERELFVGERVGA